MAQFESHRKALNREQSALRGVLTRAEDHDAAVRRFLAHHAGLHTASVANTGAWSYEDALLNDLSESRFRSIPPDREHSIAWIIWHLARIEDAAMNLLVGGGEQVLHEENWSPKLNVPDVDSGNEIGAEGIAALSAGIDFGALRAYRASVGRRTREIVSALHPGGLDQPVDPVRLERVMAEGALIEAASGVRDYWGRRTIAGLLLMPASRHILTHFNAALETKRKLS